MNCLLPISLDQWRSPIASLLRAVVEYNPQIQFSSFSNPLSQEDREWGQAFWSLSNLRGVSPKWVWKERFDLVHTASLNPRNLSIAAYFRAKGSRFLTTVNLEKMPVARLKESMIYSTAARLATHWCAVSQSVARSCETSFRGQFLGVVPNGFDPHFFDPDNQEQVTLPAAIQGRPYLLYVSALEPRKHPEFVVELAKRSPDVLIVAVGWEHPVYAADFLPMVQSQPNLIWLGHRDLKEIRSLMHKATCLLFPSEREGLPLTVIEAMAMGLPVIAQPKSSLPELIQHGVNGFLWSLDQMTEWQETARSLLSSPRSGLSQTAADTRAEQIERYSWQKVGERYGSLYSQILS